MSFISDKDLRKAPKRQVVRSQVQSLPTATLARDEPGGDRSGTNVAVCESNTSHPRAKTDTFYDQSDIISITRIERENVSGSNYS